MFGLKGMAIVAVIGLAATISSGFFFYEKGKSHVESAVALATAKEQLRQDAEQEALIATYEAAIRAQELDEQALNKVIDQIRKERADVKNNKCIVDDDYVKRVR